MSQIIHNEFKLVREIWDGVEKTLGKYLSTDDLNETSKMLEDRSTAKTPRILVYGTYNAGKSTLINALLGKELAEVADRPMTHKITPYQWNGFFLDDTPGIDAPSDHEKVARNHLESSDGVLFVLATDGLHEEQKTFDEIIKVVLAGKPILVILNNKSGIQPSSEDYIQMLFKIKLNIKHTGETAGIADIATKVPVRMVNAASALKARLENKEGLLMNSGLLDLEQEIVDICQKSGKMSKVRPVCQRIIKQIDAALISIPKDDNLEFLANLRNRIEVEKVRLTSVMTLSAEDAALTFKVAVSNACRNNSLADAENAQKQAGETVTNVFKREHRKTERLFDELLEEISEERHNNVSVSMEVKPTSNKNLQIKNVTESVDVEESGISKVVMIAGPSIGAKLNEGLIVTALLAAKQAMPSAFKGLGPVFFGRVAKLAGPAVTGVMALATAVRAWQKERSDFERNKVEKMEQEQQISDAARHMTWVLTQQCSETIENLFFPVEDTLTKYGKSLKGKKAETASDLTLLQQCKARLEVLLIE